MSEPSSFSVVAKNVLTFCKRNFKWKKNYCWKLPFPICKRIQIQLYFSLEIHFVVVCKTCEIKNRWPQIVEYIQEMAKILTDERTESDGRMDGRTDGRMDVRTVQRSNQRTDGRTDGRMDGRMDKRNAEWRTYGKLDVRTDGPFDGRMPLVNYNKHVYFVSIQMSKIMSTSLRSVDMIFLGLTIHYVYFLTIWHLFCHTDDQP